MTHIRRLLGAVLVLALSLVGAISVAPAGALTNGQLKGKTLSLTNMPTGWTTYNPPSNGSLSSGCLKDAKPDHFKGASAKASVSYEDGQLPQLSEELGWNRAAPAAYKALNKVLSGCHHLTASNDGQDLNMSIGAMSFPKIGNESNAYGITFSVKGIEAGADIVLFRVGSTLGMIVYGDIGQPDIDQLQGFVQEAVDKIEGKPAVPPTASESI